MHALVVVLRFAMRKQTTFPNLPVGRAFPVDEKSLHRLADLPSVQRHPCLPGSASPPGLFPEGNPLLLEEGAIIDGFIEGLTQMQKGGSYVLTIPAEQAYGAEPPPGSPIPPNADLTFDVEVVDFMSRDDFQARANALQQMMGQQQQGQPGEPGQPVPPPAE